MGEQGVTDVRRINVHRDGVLKPTNTFVFSFDSPVLPANVKIGFIVRKKIRKRRILRKVQAFCEEKVLRCLLGVYWYAESKNQCWQADKWRLHYLICIFPRWPPN